MKLLCNSLSCFPLKNKTYILQVTADLTPLNARKVAVKFDTFKIAGFVSVLTPETQMFIIDLLF